MKRDRSFDIAVTGVAARLPGPPNLEDWHSGLRAGEVFTQRHERQRLLELGVHPSLIDDAEYVPVSGFLPDADRFDHAFFRIGPRDAEMMDPQHRLMLEVAWSALEDAGCGHLGGRFRTGVYACGSGSGYFRRMLASGPLDEVTLEQALHGTEPDFIASLISYKLNLTGPAIAVQTACSSSLVAVHLATQALLGGDCEQALVVAAGIPFPQGGHLYMPGGIKSPSGQCRPFDAAADGVVEGGGVVCVVLRRFVDISPTDPELHGVILGTAVNNDGASKAGYYAPSIAGQQAVIRAAFAAADVEAASIGYLETHGTGTRVGDPIEWAAASEVMKDLGAAPRAIAVGALKANIGHVDAAGGLAALVKAMQVVKDGVVPPVAGFTHPSDLLETEGSPLFVPTSAQAWHGPEPRRAGVSAFGIGGTNAHVIIEAPATVLDVQRSVAKTAFVALSANDPETLTRLASRLSEALHDGGPSHVDVAHSLATGRTVLPERMVVYGNSSAQIAAKLRTHQGVVRGRYSRSELRPVVLLFPGQGAHYAGMARPFADALPDFAAALETCLSAMPHSLASEVSRALFDSAFPEDGLDQTELTQPALFALEHALATSLCGLGLRPAAVLGHSLGEIVAACVAGVLRLEDAVQLVVQRGRAMQQCAPGSMLALGCAEEVIRARLAHTRAALDIAAVNTPHDCVVAGPPEDIEAFSRDLDDDVFVRGLRSNRAFHSRWIAPAIPALKEVLGRVVLRPAEIPLVTTADTAIVQCGAELSTDYFADQARLPVRFSDALSLVARSYPGAVALEAGPGRALATMATVAGLNALPLAPTRVHDGDSVLNALGRLWTSGQPIGIERLCSHGRAIHLPTYPFFGPRWLAPEVRRAAQEPALDSGGNRASGAHARDTGGSCRPPSRQPSHSTPAVVMMRIWAEVLSHDELDLNADFFDLGGDSLLMVNLTRKVREAFGVPVAPRALLSARTLAAQVTIVSELLQKQQSAETGAIDITP